MNRRIAITVSILVLASACHSAPARGRQYVVTINPLRAILAEVVGGRAAVLALVGPGASPHTYEPTPANAAASEGALALFYAAPDVDGWAAKLPAKEKVELKGLVPESLRLPWLESLGGTHEHADSGGFDGHFWSDPLVIDAMLPELVSRLSALDPEGAQTYRANADRFSADLKKLDAEMRSLFEGVSKRPVFLFHPSWNYFMKRYELPVAGMVEPDPGKEPTAQFLKSLADTAKADNACAVFTEPQLPRRPAEVVAEACGLPIHELDPNGGIPGRMSYRELVLFNANALRAAYQ